MERWRPRCRTGKPSNLAGNKTPAQASHSAAGTPPSQPARRQRSGRERTDFAARCALPFHPPLMIRRAFRILLIGITLVLGVIAIGLAYFAYTRFFRYQAAVDRIYENIPAEEQRLSAAVRGVLETTEPDSTRTWVISRSLLSQLAPGQVRRGEWNLRGMLWVCLLPWRFDPEQRLILFAHELPFEGGVGLTYGARRYFGKPPSQLTESEALQLVTRSFSPRNPDRFQQRLEILTQRYRKVR
jgi:hypothetical protein